MKIRDLAPIIAAYDLENTLISSKAMKRLKVFYQEPNKERIIPIEVLQLLLKEHWDEIRGTKRDYLAPKTTVKATEKAYVKLAQAVEEIQKSEAELQAASALLDPVQPINTAVGSSSIPVKPKKLAQAVSSSGSRSSSYVRLATLMPGTLSFTERFDMTQPYIMIDGRILQVQALVDELTEDASLASLTDFDLLNKFDIHTLKQIQKEISKFYASSPLLEQFRKLVNQAVNNHAFLAIVKECNNAAACKNIPERYFFKTEDNIGFDIRHLFLNGFLNPVTHKLLSDDDMEKLTNHVHVGLLVKYFRDIKQPFEVKVDGQVPIQVSYFDWKILHTMKISLELRGQLYGRFMALTDLLEHLNYNDFLTSIPADGNNNPVFRFRNFQAYSNATKSYIAWNKMSDADFFAKALPVINEVKKTMSDWDSSTLNFFNAMEEFATKPDAVIRRSDSSYLRSNGEYVVRYNAGLETTEGARKGLRMLADQFKESFDIAYRYQQLPLLMRGMTPAGICVAEKMKHLCTVCAQIRSTGSCEDKFHDLFAKMMQAARKVEISQGDTWRPEDFDRYLVNTYADKTTYIDDNGKSQKLTKETIRDYLIDVICFDLPRLPRIGVSLGSSSVPAKKM